TKFIVNESDAEKEASSSQNNIERATEIAIETATCNLESNDDSQTSEISHSIHDPGYFPRINHANKEPRGNSTAWYAEIVNTARIFMYGYEATDLQVPDRIDQAKQSTE
ncbi:hypothetical protein GcC1_187049, partial [Golovinomyces cichoracearum]